MLDNYEILDNGVIRQINVFNPVKYDNEYVNNSYNTYGNSVTNMSYLRLGYIIGSIGTIPNSILDVGYGNGSFLNECKNIIKECYGNDISNYNLPDGVGFIDNIKDRHFDVVTFFDSLEHFEDISFVKDIDCNYVVISLPWCHNISDDWFSNWKHRRPDEHLYHFNDESLIKFMHESGYDLINISRFEDTIRKPITTLSNILSGVFKKRL